ncbi:hypothetical protein KBY58_05495 [Cyanobium sp. HWJ4-Hawea]|uniref:hypothetical protein n=1 Tax=Cyanobium sp. HWJ4-Hawea TaxID=2823713 RepID=UPI0020CEAF66|nr:hypothetical protein [Cyanobium sp. HWJ4-Hawea]MCP9808882.1 hypothetical protein [Cyanobium sp. HWJ4-Hawea]
MVRPVRHSLRQPVRQPVRLFHLLDGLLTQAALAKNCSGSYQRRHRQRLAMAQRLLDPLPPELVPPNQGETLFWRSLRWGTGGFLVALLLNR